MGVTLWHAERVYVSSTAQLDPMGRIGFAVQRRCSISDLSARIFNCSIVLRNAGRIADGGYAGIGVTRRIKKQMFQRTLG